MIRAEFNSSQELELVKIAPKNLEFIEIAPRNLEFNLFQKNQI